jgi:hypothetical protein
MVSRCSYCFIVYVVISAHNVVLSSFYLHQLKRKLTLTLTIISSSEFIVTQTYILQTTCFPFPLLPLKCPGSVTPLVALP